MSILKKPYELSIWEDEWVSTKNNGLRDDGTAYPPGGFVEKMICIIGSDTMESQSRALEPTLTRNVNGSVKMTFKMFQRYVDNYTGKEVENPISELLIPERKVKLKYGTYIENGVEKPRWYDFIIKNITENTTNYQHTYQLEDALVNELSRNGYDVTLDDKLMNNLGTAKDLGNKVLAGSDWSMSNSCEAIVEKVNEPLVWLRVSKNFTAKKIIDQSKDDLTKGLNTNSTQNFSVGSYLLGFYSSCTTEPYRFQFIYLDNYVAEGGKPSAKRAEDRTILEKNCQYYVDNCAYLTKVPNHYKLPDFVELIQANLCPDLGQISSWYRGDRYGFSHQGQYSEKLDKYLLKYKKGTTEYCGYVESDFNSTVLLQNLATNPEISSLSGWTRATSSSEGDRPDTEVVYGRFDSTAKAFVSAQQDLLTAGTIEGKSIFDYYTSKGLYKSYLKCTFYDNTGLILNSGPFDNRTLIKNMTLGDRWLLRYNIYNSQGGSDSTTLKANLAEIKFDSDAGAYVVEDPTSSLLFEKKTNVTYEGGTDGNKTYQCFEVKQAPYTDKQFKKDMQVRIYWDKASNTSLVASKTTPKVLYISDLEFFKETKDKNNKLIIPLTCGGKNTITGDVKKQYKMFSANQLKTAESIDDLVFEPAMETLNTSEYVPMMSASGEKTRTINVKESNYFNNLQTIAETFETWLELRVSRDDSGAITSKEVLFKNYTGKENPASFKYGINLKNIQRTFESKQLVTKLIVKMNNNELAQNGFCTIQRADNNVTGESFIYDFQYYHNIGLLDEADYNNYVYVDDDSDSTAKGYFTRLKEKNVELKNKNDQLSVVNQELLELKADNQLLEATIEAANSEIESLDEEMDSILGTGVLNLNNVLKYVENADRTPKIDIHFANSHDYENGCFQWSDLSSGNGIIVTPTTETSYGSDTSGAKAFFNGQNNSYKAGTLARLTKPVWGAASNTETKTYSADAKATTVRVWRKKPVSIATSPVERQLSNRTFQSLSDWAAAKKDLTNVFACYSINDNGAQKWGFYTGLGTNTSYSANNWIYSATRPTANIYRKQQVLSKKWSDLKATDLFQGCYYKLEDGIYYYDPSVHAWQKDPISEDVTVTMTAAPKVYLGSSDNPIIQYPVIRETITIEADKDYEDWTIVVEPIKELTERKDISGLLQEYSVYVQEKAVAEQKKKANDDALTAKQNSQNSLKNHIEQLENDKAIYHSNFYKKYSRFIQEGTWQDDKYIDDNNYYADAQSVLYDSCYPKVAYTINVISVESIPGFEAFDFELGDITYVEDENFFGSNYKEEVIINEMVDNLDDPTKKVIRVKNFKDQFQDLFQRITASVQQAEYRSGAYEKAEKVINTEGSTIAKQQFLTDALNNATAKLTAAGQQTVVWDSSGITVTEKSQPCNSIRMVGGAILLSKQNENGEQQWTTGMTSEGISASLITAGILNAGEIKIMSGRDPVFRWDELGITAFDKQNGILNTKKFVRFDRNGLYGIDANYEGESYSPPSLDALDKDATFSLTWNGLKVTGKDGAVLHLGRQGDNIFEITKGDQTVFGVDGSGTLQLTGNLNEGTTFNNQALTAIIDQHIAEFNEHTVEYGDRINKAEEEFDQLVGDMTPLSIYPSGVIVEAGTITQLGNLGDKSKVLCSQSNTNGIISIGNIYYYKTDDNGVYIGSPTEATCINFFSNSGDADKTKIYYLKPTKEYKYYSNEKWNTVTKITEITLPITSFTGFIDKANDTEAILGSLVGYNTLTDSKKTTAYSSFVNKATEKAAELTGLVQYKGGSYDKILEKTDELETTNLYYDNDSESENYGKYGYYKNDTWNWTNNLNELSLNKNKIYCNLATSKYLIYDSSKGKDEKEIGWTVNDEMPSAAAGLFAVANAQESRVQLLAEKTSNDLTNAIAGVTARATKDKAQAEMMASYITGGKCEILDKEEYEKLFDADTGKDDRKTDVVYCVSSEDEDGETVKTYYYYIPEDVKDTLSNGEKKGDWNDTQDLDKTGLVITTAGFMLEAINGQSSATLHADKIGFSTSAFTVADENNHILLQAGNVGTEQEPNITAYIAGWNVSPTSIKTVDTTLGTNGFHMYSSSYGTGSHFGATTSQNWALGIGDNFGVTSDGGLYASQVNIVVDSAPREETDGSTSYGTVKIGASQDSIIEIVKTTKKDGNTTTDSTFQVAANGTIVATGIKLIDAVAKDDSAILSSVQVQAEIANAVGGITGSGENLVVGADVLDNWDCYITSGNWTFDETAKNDDGFIWWDSYDFVTPTLHFYNENSPLSLTPKGEYRLSFKAKNHPGAYTEYVPNTAWRIQLLGTTFGRNQAVFEKTFRATGEEAEYVFSFKTGEEELQQGISRYEDLHFRIYADSSAYGFYIKDLKVELTNLLTPATVQAAIDTAASTARSLAVEEAQEGIADLNESVKDWLGIGQGTLIGADYMISPYIGGGYLNIVNGDNSVVIDPAGLGKAEGATKHDIFKITTTKGEAVKIDTEGNASFTGAITATSLSLASNVRISTDSINGLSTIATSGKYEDLSGTPNLNVYATNESLTNYVLNSALTSTLAGYATNGSLDAYLKTNDLSTKLGTLNVAYRGDVSTTQTKDETTGLITTVNTYTSSDGTTHSNTTYTYEGSEYVLLRRDNQWAGEDGSLVKISKNGLLEANNAIISGTVYATDGEFTGKVTANEGFIGNWHIEEVGVPKGLFAQWLEEKGVDTNNLNDNGFAKNRDYQLGKGIWKRIIREEAYNDKGEKTQEAVDFTCGMFTPDDDISGDDFVYLWAGCPEGKTPWQYGEWHRNDLYSYTNASGAVVVPKDGKTYSAVTPFYLTSRGYLHTTYGNIAGWSVGNDTFQKGSVKFYSGETEKLNSLVGTGQSSLRLSAGGEVVVVAADSQYYKNDSKSYTLSGLSNKSEIQFYIEDSNISELTSIEITGVYVLVPGWSYNLSYESIIDLANKSVTIKSTSGGWANYASDSVLEISYRYGFKTQNQQTTPTFRVLEDGSLYASAISSLKGKIGPFNFDQENFAAFDSKGREFFRVSSPGIPYSVFDSNSYNKGLRWGDYFQTDSCLGAEDRLYWGVKKNFGVVNNISLVNGWTFYDKNSYRSDGVYLKSPWFPYSSGGPGHGVSYDVYFQYRFNYGGIERWHRTVKNDNGVITVLGEEKNKTLTFS